MSRRTLPSGTTLRVVAGPLRAAIYGRASSDPKKRGRSIKDQFAVAELECEDRGWIVAGYYEDRDRSASRRATKIREDFQRLVSDIEAGLIDVVVYAERSRASRNLDTSVKLRTLCQDTGVKLCYDGRVYDMGIPSDFKEFTRDAVQSEEEAESTIGRAQRTARLNAQRGAPHGRIPFGFTRRYDPDTGHLIGQEPHPQHAEIVADLFERAAARESIESLTAALSNHVSDASRAGLRYLLTNKAYIGIRRYRGRDMENCQWKPIVDESVFWEVQDLLQDPTRRTVRDTRARHLLSVLAECAVCVAEGRAETVLVVKPTGGVQRYKCQGNHVAARKEPLEAFVETAVFAWLSSDAAIAAFRTRSDEVDVDRVKTRLRNMRAQLESARQQAGEVDDFGVPALSIESLAATERLLLPKVAEDEVKLRALTSARDPLLGRLVGVPLEEVVEVWNEEMEIPQRRHVLRRVVNVELRRASKRGVHRLEADRVGLTFAGEEGFRARPQRGSLGWVKGS